MRIWSYIAALAGALALFGCSGGAKPAQAPESNPWADYKGTFASGGSQATDADAKTPAPESKSAATESKTAKGDAKPKKGDAKPKKSADAKPRAELKPEATATDAKAMYGTPTETKPDDSAADPAAKKTTKRAAGKPGKKPTTAKR